MWTSTSRLSVSGCVLVVVVSIGLTDHFMIGVPSGRSISTVTHTDWEGVGVEPDVKVAAEKRARLVTLSKDGLPLWPEGVLLDTRRSRS